MSLPPATTAETLQKRYQTMKKVLLHIQAKKSFDELSFDEKRILKECFDAGFFEGIVLLEMASGRIIAEYRHEPRLTLKGLQFLDTVKTIDLSQDNESCKPDKTYASKSKGDAGKKFYKSGVFWAAVTVIVSIILWCIDRFILCV